MQVGVVRVLESGPAAVLAQLVDGVQVAPTERFPRSAPSRRRLWVDAWGSRFRPWLTCRPVFACCDMRSQSWRRTAPSARLPAA